MGPQQMPGAAALSQDVVVSVSEINVLSMSAGAVTLTIDGAVPGQAPGDAQDAGTTYGITTNGTGKKITAALSNPYASGLSLSLSLTAPAGAASTQRTLGPIAQDLVTGLSQVAASDLTITYTASATLEAVPNVGSGGETHTVTFTLVDM